MPDRRRGRAWAAFLPILLAAGPSPAVETRPASPVDVVKSYTEALMSGDLPACSRLLHPASLVRVRDLLLALADHGPAAAPVMSALGLKDKEEIGRLPAEELYERFLQQSRQSQPRVMQLVGAGIEIMGTLEEGADVRHVLYRTRVEVFGSRLAFVEVMSLQRDGAAWKVQLPGEFDLMIAGVREAAKEAADAAATLVVMTDAEAVLAIDGRDVGIVSPGKTESYSVPPGLHKVSATSSHHEEIWDDVMVLHPKEEKQLLVSFSQEKPAYITDGITPPVKTVGTKPVYPPGAREQALEGKVILEVIVSREGDVTDVRVLKSNPVFDEAAIEAVRKWKYSPALRGGRPITVYLTVIIEFNLR